MVESFSKAESRGLVTGEDYFALKGWLMMEGVRIGEMANPELDLADPYSAFVFQVKVAVSELERKLTVLRLKRAMAFAKGQGRQ